MNTQATSIADFLSLLHPYDSLSVEARSELAGCLIPTEVAKDQDIYTAGEALDGIYLIASGEVEVREPNGTLVSILGPRNSFGERGLMRDGLAATSAQAVSDSLLYVLPSDLFSQAPP